ncbi:MAG: transporter substrate-binding domain-containing protein [Colwellia sp.]|jgi:ABC-type amino acid transport substrate-binding protein|nr:transporter substrate-binding domain-containing protein [Colwellia sp.]
MIRYITLILLILFSLESPAAEREQPILGVIDFFPFGYSLEDNIPRGMVFDIEAVLEEVSSLKIDARLMSVARALRSASLGQNDLLFSYRDEQMVPNVIWLGNVGCLTPLVVSHKSSGIKTLDDLAGKRVGFVSLGYFDVKMKSKWPIKPVLLNDNFIMLKMLLRGRLDAIIINDGVLNAYLANQSILAELPEFWPQQLAQPLALETYETHLSMSKDSEFQALIPQFKQAILKAKQQGRFKEIFKKHGSKLGGYCFTDEELKLHKWLE